MGRLRIVAGRLGGRRFTVPDVAGLRPTSERVREALFSRLGDRVVGAHVVDAFAGSGALGLEALSRGAARVDFLERHPRAVEALRRTLRDWGLQEAARVVPGDAVRWARDAGGPVDGVLADPPYAGDDGPRFLDALAGSDALEIGGWLAVERPSKAGAAAIPGFRLEKSARYGDSALDVWIRAFAAPGA